MTNEVRQIRRNFGIFFAFLIPVFFVPNDGYSIELKQRQLGAGSQGTAMAGGYVEEVPGTEGMSEMEVISTLRHDIQLLDEEINKCERKRKGWVAATVVGGVGVVGTGIGAIVQHNKIQDKKAELGQVQGEVAGTKASIKDAQNRLNNMQ